MFVIINHHSLDEIKKTPAGDGNSYRAFSVLSKMLDEIKKTPAGDGNPVSIKSFVGIGVDEIKKTPAGDGNSARQIPGVS